MNYNIKKWGKLEQKTKPKNYDLGGILGSILSGAATGSAIPGWGTAVGGAVGLIGGLLGSKKQKEEQRKQQELQNQQMLMAKQQQMNALPQSGGGLPGMLAMGGYLTPETLAKSGIYIKPSKRDTFTAAATKHGKSVQGFASQVLANKENYSPAMVKKANFAKNASKWNHAYGGPEEEIPVNSKYSKYSVRSVAKMSEDELKEHNALMSHLHSLYPKEFTNETPNQYAFDYLRNPEISKKLTDRNLRWDKKSEEVLGYYYPSVENTPEFKTNLPSGNIENEMARRLKNKFAITTSQFAKNPEAFRKNMDLSEYNAYLRYVSGEEYTPEKSQGKLTREQVMKDAQEAINKEGNMVTQLAKGGYIKGGLVNPLSTQYGSIVGYNSGGTHSQNPLGGIPLSKAPTGEQNTVEQGETSFKFKNGKYIFSNRLKVKK